MTRTVLAQKKPIDTAALQSALVAGDGIIINGVPGSGADPFDSLLVAGTGIGVAYNTTTRAWTVSNTGGGVSDGDKGDITVSSSGSVWTIDSLAVTNAKINDVAWSKVSGTPTTLSGYGITDSVALTTGKLSQFAATTSSELAGVISDETGSGALVFATSPTLVTPTLGAASATSLAMTNIVRCTEQTQTPSGTTATLTLNDGNHQTLSLGSASGTVTATLTVPSSSAAGTVIVLQGSVVRGITWAVSSGSIVWMGTQPTWSSMGANKSIIVAWRWNGSVMRLAASEEST
jgi:hypothetical protein